MRSILFIVFLSIVSCATELPKETPEDTQPPPAVEVPEETPAPPVEVVPEPLVASVPISWEKNHPERKAWSNFVVDLMGGELFDRFDSARDAEALCPKYRSLPKAQKVEMWAELISGMALYESSWNPKTRFMEPAPLHYYSEGLLQLSYEDLQWAKYCKFKKGDPAKSILDPILNLDCGIRILANQIKNKGLVMMSSGVYWSTLKIGGRYSKIKEISAMITNHGFCR